MPDERRDAHLANLLGAFVTDVGDDLRVALFEETGAGGMGPAALLTVDTWPGCSIDFLRQVLGLTHSGAVRLVSRLGRSGALERGPGEDGRTAALRLTPPGRAIVRRVRLRRRRILERTLGETTEHERRVLSDVLDRVLRRSPRSRMEARGRCRLCDHSVCVGEVCPIGSSVHE